MRDEGTLIERSCGVFRFAGAEMISNLDLVAVSKRSPRGIICLNSAFSFLDLTDEVPTEVHLAIPRGSRPPSIEYPPTRVHVFVANTFELGHENTRLENNATIRMYSPGRSVVDAMRLKNQVGADVVAYDALRRYLNLLEASPGDLLRLARRLRARGLMSNALMVLMG